MCVDLPTVRPILRIRESRLSIAIYTGEDVVIV